MRHQIEGAKDSCHAARSSDPIPQMRCDTGVLHVSRLARLEATTSLRWACQIQPGVQHWSLFAYSSYLFMVYWAGHFPCLLEQLLRQPPTPPLLLTGEVWRPLACCSLSGSPLPAVTWCAAFTGDRMNNLFVEFSPSLTFLCLRPGGSSFNNIDSAPLFCASSDKVGKQRERTQYQNHGYQGCCVFHTMTFAMLSLLKRYIWTCGWGLNGLQAFELGNIVFRQWQDKMEI